MCLTIPKKVISIAPGTVIVEDFKGDRQEIKSIVELEPGDYCLTQQNVAVQVVEKKHANEIFKLLNRETGR